MAQQDISNSNNSARRFDIELFIVHPTIDPTAISDALGLVSSNSHRVGNPRQTPKKTPLPGNYRDTRWRHSVQLELKDQWFAAEVTHFVDSLVAHKAFLKSIRATGGTSCLVIQFFDSHYGDNVPQRTLAKIVDLELDFGVECFSDPQR